MYCSVVDGKAVFPYCLIAVSEATKDIKKFFRVEGNAIICYSAHEKDYVISLLDEHSIAYMVQICDYTEEKYKTKDFKYKNVDEVKQHLTDNAYIPELNRAEYLQKELINAQRQNQELNDTLLMLMFPKE